MRNRLMGSILTLLAVLVFSSIMLAQTDEQSAAAKAKMAAPTPDLSGVWMRMGQAPASARQDGPSRRFGQEQPTMTPWAATKYAAVKPLYSGGKSGTDLSDPVYSCFPPGVPRIYSQLPVPMEIIQIPGRVIELFEYDHFVRHIYTDGREHHKDLAPTWMGDSTGRWEGDTLVVDTIGFNDKTAVDSAGHPHSEDLHVVERIRRLDHDTLVVDITIDDPKAYTKPWGGQLFFQLKPDWNIMEWVCEDNVNFNDFHEKSAAPAK